MSGNGKGTRPRELQSVASGNKERHPIFLGSSQERAGNRGIRRLEFLRIACVQLRRGAHARCWRLRQGASPGSRDSCRIQASSSWLHASHGSILCGAASGAAVNIHVGAVPSPGRHICQSRAIFFRVSFTWNHCISGALLYVVASTIQVAPLQRSPDPPSQIPYPSARSYRSSPASIHLPIIFIRTITP